MRANVRQKKEEVFTAQGGLGTAATPEQELRRRVLTALLFEDCFYEEGEYIAKEIASLVTQVKPKVVADLAIEARGNGLRQVPLFLLRELARTKGNGTLIADTLANVIQRADELGEFVALYYKDVKPKKSEKPGGPDSYLKAQPLSAPVKRALARAFRQFDSYQLAKHDHGSAQFSLLDVMRLVHPKPLDPEQAELWRQLKTGTLPTPDTWEVILSGAKEKGLTKTQAWEQIIDRWLSDGKVKNHLAILRNARNIEQAKVSADHMKRYRAAFRDPSWAKIKPILPFQFLAAAKVVPSFEKEIDAAMLTCASKLAPLDGETVILVDHSGSMEDELAKRGKQKRRRQPEGEEFKLSRLDAACGLAVMARAKGELRVYTFSNAEIKEVPSREGMALRDAIVNSQRPGGTHLAEALRKLKAKFPEPYRVIVITDEQSSDGILPAWTEKSYVINVAPYKIGVSYGDGWIHCDGFSERVFDYIAEIEKEKR